MALDNKEPIEQPHAAADDPAAAGEDSTVKTDERARRSVVTDAKGRTGAEIRFQQRKEVQEAQAGAVDASSESNREDPTTPDARKAPEESGARTGLGNEGRTNESAPHAFDGSRDEPLRLLTSDRVDRPPHTVFADAKGRTGAEIRFQQGRDVSDPGDRDDRSEHEATTGTAELSQPGSSDHVSPLQGVTPRAEQQSQVGKADAHYAHGEHFPQSPSRKQEVNGGSELGGIESSRERANQFHVVDRLESTTDYDADASPTVDERYLVRDRARPVPLFDGPPTRDQSNQGTVGDCGIVATLGAIAAHRPEAIAHCLRQTGEGAFEVKLHDVDGASASNLIARPNGDTTTYILNDELPVRTDESSRPLAGIQADRSGWAAILEKAVAAQDQTWSQAERSDWQSEWLLALKDDIDADRNDEQLPPSPDASPTGYDRLNLGSTVLERTNLLAQITGEAAETRRIPDEQAGRQALLDDLRSKLSEGKPIVLGTRAQLDNEIAPYSPDVFSFDHVYEVVEVTADRIQLRNPWGVDEFGRSSNPPPMDADSFWELFRKYNRDGSREGYYSTLE